MTPKAAADPIFPMMDRTNVKLWSSVSKKRERNYNYGFTVIHSTIGTCSMSNDNQVNKVVFIVL